MGGRESVPVSIAAFYYSVSRELLPAAGLIPSFTGGLGLQDTPYYLGIAVQFSDIYCVPGAMPSSHFLISFNPHKNSLR